MAFYWWAREFNCRQVPVELSLLVIVCDLQRRIGSTFRETLTVSRILMQLSA